MLNHGCLLHGVNRFFLPILITILKSGTSTSLLNCFAKRSFPIQQTKILFQIPFSTRSVFCVMKTAQIFIQDFAKRFCSMFISSNQLPGLREAFFVFTLLSKQSSDSQFEGFLQLWFNVPRLPAGRAFYTKFINGNILNDSIFFTASNQPLLAGRRC